MLFAVFRASNSQNCEIQDRKSHLEKNWLLFKIFKTLIFVLFLNLEERVQTRSRGYDGRMLKSSNAPKLLFPRLHPKTRCCNVKKYPRYISRTSYIQICDGNVALKRSFLIQFCLFQLLMRKMRITRKHVHLL